MAAQKCAEQGMALTEGVPSFSAVATFYLGAALVAQRRYEEGITGMRRGISAFRATGGTLRAWEFYLLASGLGKAGRPEEGLQVLEEGFVSVSKTGEQFGSTFLHRAKGQLLLAQNPLDVAEAERVSARRSKSPAGKVRDQRSCVPRPVSHACSTSRAIATRRAQCSPRSTAGSPRVSTPPI